MRAHFSTPDDHLDIKWIKFSEFTLSINSLSFLFFVFLFCFVPCVRVCSHVFTREIIYSGGIFIFKEKKSW